MIEPSDRELAVLRQVYRAAAEHLAALMATTDFQQGKAAGLLRQVDAIARALGVWTDAWVAPATRTLYQNAAQDVTHALRGRGFAATAGFNAIDTRAVRIFTGQIARELAGANQQAAESARRIIRQTSQRVLADAEISTLLAKGLVAGGNLNQISRSLRQRLSSAGRELLDSGKLSPEELKDMLDLDAGYIQAGSRRMEIGAYVHMVANSQLRQVVTDATVERLNVAGEELGDPALFDLVTIEGPRNGCDICDFYVGKVYSLRGLTSGYEILPARPPWHPNCRHFLAPYIDLISDKAVAAREKNLRAMAGSGRADGRISMPRVTPPEPIAAPATPRVPVIRGPQPEMLAIPPVALSDAETQAVRGYTAQTHEALNRALRGEEKLTPELRAVRDTLDAALKKLARYEGAVERNVRLPAHDAVSTAAREQFLRAHAEGRIVTYREFVSATRIPGSFHEARDPAERIKLLFRDTKTGRLIEDRSSHTNEREVLFARNSRFIVESNQVGTDGAITIVLRQVTDAP